MDLATSTRSSFIENSLNFTELLDTVEIEAEAAGDDFERELDIFCKFLRNYVLQRFHFL